MLADADSQTTEFPGTGVDADRSRRAAAERALLVHAGYLNAMEYRFIKMLAEFDENGWWQGEGIRSFSHWLNYKLGLSSAAARDKVRVARALGNLPAIDDAFERGAVSYSKVRAMTRVATPANENFLLQIAEHGTASHMEQLVRRYRQCTENAEATITGEIQQSSLSWHRDDDDSYVMHVRLPYEDGALVIKAIEKVRDEMLVGEEAGASAEALALRDSDIPIRKDRANALVALAEKTLSEATATNTGRVAEKYQVFLHINANDAHPDNHINAGHCCYDSNNRVISREKVRQLACDAALTLVTEDDRGNLLSVGHRTRTIPRAISHALAIRDGSCRFPGCVNSRWIDAHHVKHWADGGETRLDNLVTLCRYHHRELHKGTYRIEPADGHFRFINHLNQVIETAHYPQFQQPQSAALTCVDARQKEDKNLKAKGASIDHRTADTRWLGESIDYSIAIPMIKPRQDLCRVAGPDEAG